MGWGVGMRPMTSPKGAEPTIFIGYKGGKEKGAGLPAVGGASMRGRGFMERAWLWAVGVASGVGVAFRERVASEVGVASGSRRGFGGAWLQKRAWLLMGVASHSRSGFRRGGAWLRKWAWLQAVGVSQRRM